ncbi:MAG: helix-turn-helix domain-containing protein [Rhizomicrobium sp.]
MTSFQTTISPSRRIAARFVFSVRRAIQQALIEEYRSRGLTQAQIARELGIHRSVINKEIRGEGNLTLKRIGELAYVLGRKPQFALAKKEVRAHANIHAGATTRSITWGKQVEPDAQQSNSSLTGSSAIGTMAVAA